MIGKRLWNTLWLFHLHSNFVEFKRVTKFNVSTFYVSDKLMNIWNGSFLSTAVLQGQCHHGWFRGYFLITECTLIIQSTFTQNACVMFIGSVEIMQLGNPLSRNVWGINRLTPGTVWFPWIIKFCYIESFVCLFGCSFIKSFCTVLFPFCSVPSF